MPTYPLRSYQRFLNCRNVDQSRKEHWPLPLKTTTHTTAPTSHNWLIHKIKALSSNFLLTGRCAVVSVWTGCAFLRFLPKLGDKSFWKVENRPKQDHTQALWADSTAGGRHTQTDSHTLTKWRLWQKSFPLNALTILCEVELNYNSRWICARLLCNTQLR